jgi:DNA-binding transcriptional LysR family regulator
MELRQLRHFVAVADELHFGRAAEKLGMTQPPLSQSIQRLESELGVRLFERTHRHVELTPTGAQLLPIVRGVLTQADQLPALAQSLLRGDRGLLRLAFVSTADYGVLPELLRRYRSRFPEVHIELLEATGDRQIEGIISEEIDAGIVIRVDEPVFPSTLEYLPLQRENLVLAVSEDERRDVEEPVELARYANRPLIIFPRRVAPGLHDAVTQCFAGRGLVPRFGQEAIQMQTIVSLVSAGLGIAIVPSSMRNLQRIGVRYLELAGETSAIESGLIWRRGNRLPTLRNIINVSSEMGESAVLQSSHERRRVADG